MKAALKPRINLDGRTALETVIPLATPFIVFVDPASACNFKCLSGDTPVNTIYGAIPIAELARTYTEVPVFTYDFETGYAKVATARNIRHTGVSKLVRVAFDDGSHIDCTPDHKFHAFKTGNKYVGMREWASEAKDLAPGTRLRAIVFPRVGVDPYPLANCGRQSKTVHLMVAEWKLGRPLLKEERVHHENHDKTDWSPGNLTVCRSQVEHFDRHPEVSERMRGDNPTKNGVGQEWRDKIGLSNRGKVRSGESRERYRLAAIRREHARRERREFVNHKVVSVTPLDGRHDTYCLEVPDVGWFFANNVLVKNCTFCPTAYHEFPEIAGRYNGIMKLDLFKKIIDDLDDFDDPIKVLRLYKDGEPFLNKRLADMIRYAKLSGRVDYIDTTTNGSLITPERLGPVLEAGLDKINISVDGMTEETYLAVTKAKFDFARFVRNVKWLYANKGDCEVVVKTIGDILTPDQRQEFYGIFGDHCDRIFVENLAPCWPQFDTEKHTGVTITKGIYQQPISDTDVCPYIFYGYSVNADGLVSSCFVDWGRKLIIGDVREQSMLEIWNSDKMNELRLQHLEGKRRQNPVCGSCGQVSHCLPDNIDAHRVELLDRMRAHLQVAHV